MRDGSAIAVKTGYIVLASGWLPVNGLHTVLKVSRRLKFPLADDGPEDENTTDGGSDSCNYDNGGFSDLGGAGGSRDCCGSLAGISAIGDCSSDPTDCFRGIGSLIRSRGGIVGSGHLPSRRRSC